MLLCLPCLATAEFPGQSAAVPLADPAACLVRCGPACASTSEQQHGGGNRCDAGPQARCCCSLHSQRHKGPVTELRNRRTENLGRLAALLYRSASARPSADAHGRSVRLTSACATADRNTESKRTRNQNASMKSALCLRNLRRVR